MKSQESKPDTSIVPSAESLKKLQTDFNLSDDEVGTLKDGLKAALAPLAAFKPDADTIAAFKDLKEAGKEAAQARAQSTLSPEQQAAIGAEVKQGLSDMFTRYAYDTIQGLDVETVLRKGRQVATALGVNPMVDAALDAASLPQTALQSMAANDYGPLQAVWGRTVEGIRAPIAAVVSALDLLAVTPAQMARDIAAVTRGAARAYAAKPV